MDFSSRRTWVIVAVVITVILVIGALVWCYMKRQANESFSSMRSSNIQTACRIHKVFLPNEVDGHSLYTLQVVNRVTGEYKIVGPTANKFRRHIGHKHHLYSYSEANDVCMRNSRFAGFVIITPDVTIYPERITNPNQGEQRHPTLFFETADESKLTPITHNTYINHPVSLHQHVYKLYPLLDKCKDDHFCRFPFLLNASELDLEVIDDDDKLVPSGAKRNILAAQRYCCAIRQNESSQLVGFTCGRDNIVKQFYKCQTNTGKDYDFENKWIELANISEDKIDKDCVFYSYSEEPCRKTVADDDFMVQLRQWTSDWESDGANIHPMLSEKDIHRRKRICKDNAEEGKYDYNCFLNERDTGIVRNLLMSGNDHSHKAADLALDDSPEMGASTEKDLYKIYKDANNKLYFRQRDRCCENRIGHSGTIPEGASERVSDIVRTGTGCNVDLFSDGFFNDQCNAVCNLKVGEDTPIYRKDLERCVPESQKCLPNRTVCNSDKLKAQFEKDCPGECSKVCGISHIDKDRGFKRLHQYPSSVDEQIDVIGQYPRQSLNRCQARCDASDECDMFTISPCSTSSDDCFGNCILQKRQNKNSNHGDVKLSKDNIEPRTRIYTKSENDNDDPHVKDFYKRNNYCRIDGQPYYQYVMGADYSKLRQLPAWAAFMKDVSSTGQPEGFTVEPEIAINKWYGEDAMYSTKDGSTIKLDSFFPALLVGKTTTGETIHFRNDKKVTPSLDEVLRISLLLRFDKNRKIKESEVRIMITDALSKGYNIRVERVLPDTLNRFKCIIDIYVQDNPDGSNEHSMLKKALNNIENMSGTHQYTIIHKSSPIYVSTLLDRYQMEVRSNSANLFDKFTINPEQIKAKRHMENSVKLDVVFNNMNGLSRKGQVHEVRFNVNLKPIIYRWDPEKETIHTVAAKHNITFLKLAQMNNFILKSSLKVPDIRTKVFVDLELKPFSNEWHFFNGIIFPLNLNNKYVQLKSGNYTFRMSSRQNDPVILLKHEGSNDKYEWFFTNNKSNFFHAYEMFGKMFFENIALCFRVQDMPAGQSISISHMSTK